ncbi:MAG TPA: ABC transporter ATP-binding protein [Bryobacteraceae bacterium]|nr:ABC transporter ATP-binding protein [Bryobacteraceae bacterium]
MNPVIELHGLEVRFGQRVILDKLNGALSGRAIGLLGPNGAGKSTLINTLLGFHQPWSGTARIFGYDIRVPAEAREVRGLFGYMPENDSFIANMSGVRFVRLMAELAGLPPSEAMERTHEAFFLVGLGEARYRNIGTYSTGMKQLVKLAQAIAHGPKLLFLDEPTNGLDPPARQRMIELIQEIRNRGELHLILSSHLLRDVEECCDEVLILKNGRSAAVCNLEEERRANRRFLELETRGANGTFVEAIEGLGCEAACGAHGRMKIVLPDGVEIRQIYALAAARDVQIRRLNHKRDSLEDIFLKAMEAPNGSL